MTGAILLQVILIFLNAVFASAEIAVISMNDRKLKHLTQEGNKKAKKLFSLTRQPAKFLATIQVAITLAGLLGGAFAADNFASPIVNMLVEAGVSIPVNILNSAVLVLITLVLTYFSLVFGELVPKRIAMKKTESLALGMSGILYFVSKLFAPLVWFLTASTNFILKVMGINPNEEGDVVTEEEIRMMLAEGNEQGSIQAEESEMIQNIFEFDDINVEQVSTRRRDVVALYLEDSEDTWEETIQESRFTYYPICRESMDDVVGILDTKDYFRLKDRNRKYIMEQAVNKPFFVPDGMRANVLFKKMKQSRNYFAVILDEYGGMLGIVTLHDLIETLVGDLEEEEAPPKEEAIEKVGENLWKIQGYADLKEVGEKLHADLPVDIYDTFSGFVCGAVDRVPEEGEQFSCESCGLKMEIKDVSKHIVTYALVEKKEEDSDWKENARPEKDA